MITFLLKDIAHAVQHGVRRVVPCKKLTNYLFIVGAQKAGTSALFSYIEKHPRLKSGFRKELGYFSSDYLYEKGDDYYRSYFGGVKDDSYGLDATPEYLYYPESALRIRNFAPNSKIVILLREPVSRAMSAFNMYQQIPSEKWFQHWLKQANGNVQDFFLPIASGKVTPTLEYFLDREFQVMSDGLDIEEPSLIRRGIYAPQIERFITLFGKENVLVIFSPELKSSPEEVTNRVLDFVGIDRIYNSVYPLTHVREYQIDMSNRNVIKERASELYAKDKEQLEQQHGLIVPW
ncbi:MAG: sulfotransferase domain-containing protein [Gallionella sp.]|nr:sulfotransferase domain-containing protein [Gallionella sp.]